MRQKGQKELSSNAGILFPKEDACFFLVFSELRKKTPLTFTGGEGHYSIKQYVVICNQKLKVLLLNSYRDISVR